jgi:hypothetical protein
MVDVKKQQEADTNCNEEPQRAEFVLAMEGNSVVRK